MADIIEHILYPDPDGDADIAFSDKTVARTAKDALSELERIEAHYRVVLREIQQHGVPANPRWVSISRTHIEQGAMALRRALYRPNEGV